MKQTPQHVPHDETQMKSDDRQEKRPFVEPKLTWVEPTLSEHGEIEAKAGFFGTFYP